MNKWTQETKHTKSLLCKNDKTSSALIIFAGNAIKIGNDLEGQLRKKESICEIQ